MLPEEFEKKKPGEVFPLWGVVAKRSDYIHRVFLEEDHANAYLEKKPNINTKPREDTGPDRMIPLIVKRISVVKANDGRIFSARGALSVEVWGNDTVRERAMSKLSFREKEVLGL